FHFCVNSLGQVFGASNPVTLASRLGPRHCGQSCAQAPPAASSIVQPTITPVVGFALLIVAPFGFFPVALTPRSNPPGRAWDVMVMNWTCRKDKPALVH